MTSKTFTLKYRSHASERTERMVFESDPAVAEASARARARGICNETGVADFKLYWPDDSTMRFTLNTTEQVR
jgi:hypothetical protein